MTTPPPEMPELIDLRARVLELDKQLAEQMKNTGDPAAMIRVQALITKRNEAHARMAEMQRKLHKELEGIVNNMG